MPCLASQMRNGAGAVQTPSAPPAIVGPTGTSSSGSPGGSPP